MKSSLLIKIGSSYIGFLSTSPWGGDLFLFSGICQKRMRIENSLLIGIGSYWRFILFSLREEISSHLVEYAKKNQNEKFTFKKNRIMLYRFFIHFSLGRRSLLILPD